MSARLQTLGKLEAKVVCQYVWGARQGHRDELILRNRDATTSSSESSGEFLNERLWCLMDYYDPTSLVDNSGSVVERYRFSAFGLRTIMSAGFTPLDTSGYDWDFAFHGQFLDLDTGYYNYGFRYYSPELGRWLSRDPIGEQDDDNMYIFCANNACNSNDLLGLLSGNLYSPNRNGKTGFDLVYEFVNGAPKSIIQQDVHFQLTGDASFNLQYDLKYTEFYLLDNRGESFDHDSHTAIAANLLKAFSPFVCGQTKNILVLHDF